MDRLHQDTQSDTMAPFEMSWAENFWELGSQRPPDFSTTTSNLRKTSETTQNYDQLTAPMSDPKEDMYEELGMGILKSNAALLLWMDNLATDADQNFTTFMEQLHEQIEDLEKDKSDQPGVVENLRSHIKAKKILEQYQQRGVVFTKELMARLACPGRSFSLEENSEDTSRRENTIKERLTVIAGDLEKVTSSKFASLEEKKAALNQATTKKDDVLLNKVLFERHDAMTLKRKGLSKTLWNESFEEMMERQLAERRA